MTPLLIFIIVCVAIYCGVSWLLPRFLAWLCKRKYRLNVDIGRIGMGLWYFTLRDVKLSKNHISVHIDEIGFRSSFFSNEVTKLLSVVIRDLRIDVNSTRVSSTSSSSVFGSDGDLSFHNQKIPPAIITFVQFMAIHVYNITVMLLRAESPEWLVHASAGEVHLDGSLIHNARTLLVNISISSSTAKLLKHAVESDPQTCLGELSFGMTLEATVIAQGPLSVEKLYLDMQNTQAVIYDAIYSFARRSRTETVASPPQKTLPRSTSDLVYNLLPIIPKNFKLKVENSMLNGMRDESKVDFSATLKCLMMNTQMNQVTSLKPVQEPTSRLPQLFMSCQVENFDVARNNEEIISMSKLRLDGNYDDFDILNVDLVLDELTLSYEHLFMKPWVVSKFLKPQETSGIVEKSRAMLLRRKASWFEKFCDSCQISGFIEVKKVALWCRLPEDPKITTIGFQLGKFSLEKVSELRNSAYDSPMGKFIFGRQHWTLDLLIESCWCHFESSLLNTDIKMLKKYHTWGTPLFFGSCLVKARSQNQNEVKINVMLDLFRMEWSPTLAKFLLQCVKCASEYRIGTVHDKKTSSSIKKTSSATFTWSWACTNANLYWLAADSVCLMQRVDKIVVDINKGKTEVVMEGAKMSPLKPSIQHGCVRSEEIKSMCAHIKHARFLYLQTTNELTVNLHDQLQLKWSTNLHLKGLTLLGEIKSFLDQVTPPSSNQKGAVAPIANESEAKSRPRFHWSVRINGESQFLISLPKKHEVNITTKELAFEKTEKNSGFETELLKIAVDDADIFSVEKLRIARQDDDPDVAEERNKEEEFVLKKNKVWCTTIDSFKAVFPFEHNYAAAVQGELISVWKWLKSMHKKKKDSFTINSPLPSDLHIRLREFLFEMSDDPFEVKLRDNYELLEDEYKESVKRQKRLDAKVADIYKTNLLSMPPGKVEELYAGLSKMNAETYVRRSKQMKKQGPMRTRLFAWSLSDVQLIALADTSLHGTENVVRIMAEIDGESPWPEDGLEFSTLWCRSVSASIQQWKFELRDFRQPLMDITGLQVFGKLVGAEQMANKRARRCVQVELGEPWGTAIVERSMTSLKFYHDLNLEVTHLRYAFGPCWEPVIAQCNLSFEKILPPSRDPSPTLPWWDKMRLLFHGQLIMVTRQLTMLLHASLDPYNTTEEMELTWTDIAMSWTTGKFVFQGDFNVYVRTASKYDDCRLLHLPHLKLSLKLTWVCLSDPHDHHAVMPCAPDKLPEYSSNQEHDSFRAFRSQNLNVSIALETKGSSPEADCPIALLYGSTLRWFENLKLILSGVTRPTRRGAIFNNLRAKKKQLSRHYKKVRILFGFHRFQVFYWMSFAMQRGFELSGGRVSFSSEHILNLVPTDDGLTHRPRAEWSVLLMNCDLNDAEIWLKSALQGSEADLASLRQPVEKCYCLSVVKVTYGRETVVNRRNKTLNSGDTPTHRLVVHGLRGAWTKSNRDVAFALFDTFIKSKQLKKNLSTEALKGFRGETNSKSRSARPNTEGHVTTKGTDSLLTPTPSVLATTTASPSPLTTAGSAASMLQQLIAEVESKPVVFSDDLSVQTTGQRLQGLQACQEDDVVFQNWLISLINSQVLLKGCETKGYVILSAAKAEILQKVHNPVWKDRTLVSKTTWVGILECMQYYATVAAGNNDKVDENIMWLTLDNIEEKEDVAEPPDVLHLVGSGHSVGGVVTETVGASSVDTETIQLQRIVSRCKCEFFYAGYGETSIDPSTLEEVPPLPIDETGPWERKERAVDAFTLMHHDLDVCTNSLQYAMILDIVNHLLLYVEPQRKELYERLQRMRFQLALHSTEDQRRPIQGLQNQVRSLVSQLRRLERETYLVQRDLQQEGNEIFSSELDSLEKQVYECKELLSAQSEELDMMLSCYKETQLSANQRLATMKGDKPVTTVRANEIVFKHAKWRLTETDGQLGISDLVLSNFLYTKNSKSDDSVEHLLELGYVNMVNLLPNQIYKEVLSPSEIQSNMPIDRKTAVRIFCREKAPVGGISVKEHLEINVVPITIGLTKKFYNTMVNFCFPGRESDIDGEEEVETTEKGGKKIRTVSKKGKDTNFYVKIDKKDDVEKMKERAEKNKLFIYIKITEVPVRVSYKGNKEKNIEDIRDFSLVIPTLEYHNVTWTWLDLLLSLKSDSRRVILSQAIKQKLTIKSKKIRPEEPTPQEEDKARILFGARAVLPAAPTKVAKRSVLKLPRM